MKRSGLNMAVLGAIAILIAYVNCYDAQYSIYRLLLFAGFGAAYYLFVYLYTRIEDSISAFIRNIISWIIDPLVLLVGFYFVIHKNQALQILIHGVIPVSWDVSNVSAAIILFAIFFILSEITILFPSGNRFLDAVGSNFLIIIPLQIIVPYMGKIFNEGYLYSRGLVRALYTLALADAVGYWVRKVLRSDLVIKRMFVIDKKTKTILFCSVFAPALFLMMIQNTYIIGLFYGTYPIYETVIRLSLAISLCIFASTYNDDNNRLMVNAILFVAISASIYFVTCGEIFIYAVYVYVAAAIGLNDKTIVKEALVVSIISFLTVAVLSMIGVIPDTVAYSNYMMAHNFGFGNENWTTMQMTSIIIMFLYVREHSQIIDKIINLLAVIGIIWVEKAYTNGRTALYGAFFLTVGLILYYLADIVICFIGKKPRKVEFYFNLILTEGILLGSTVFGLAFSWIYNNEKYGFIRDLLSSIPGLGTVMARFDSSYRGLHEYRPGLFGKVVLENNSSVDFFWLDTLYVRQLLKHGIVIFLCFFVLMSILTFKLCKKKRYVQAYAIAAIPVMGIFEALVGDPMYNIFPIVALTTMKQCGKRRYQFFANRQRIEVLCVAALMIISVPILVSKLRTIYVGYTLYEQRHEYELMIIISTVLIVLLYLAFNAGKIGGIFASKHRLENRYLWKILISVAFLLTGLIICNFFINSIRVRLMDSLNAEREIMTEIIQASEGKVYAYSMPEIYCKEYDGIHKCLYNCDGLGMSHNSTVITDASFDSYLLTGKGYLYMPISGDRAVYTNDEVVIDTLQSKGYHLTGYCTYSFDVDMAKLAELNDLECNEYGEVILRGPEKQILMGPYVDISGGDLTASYDIKLDSKEKGEDHDVCILSITTNYGLKEVASALIKQSEFSEEGTLTYELPFEGGENLYEFKVLPKEDTEFMVKSIDYRRTPAYDTHIRVDEKGRQTRIEYYDLEGNPLRMQDGYYCVEYVYDDGDRIICVRYFGPDHNPVITESGYAEIRCSYNSDGLCDEESYYGTDDQLVTLPSGYSLVRNAYDEYGNLISKKYYDKKGKLIVIAGGYAEYKRIYDDKNRVVREEYYGTDNTPMLLDGSYSSVEYVYNEDNNLIRRIYYDVDGTIVNDEAVE